MNREDEILAAILSLHQATEIGFKAVDVRFEAVDARFDAHDARFDALETRFAAFETRCDQIQREMREGFTGVNRRLDRLERSLAP